MSGKGKWEKEEMKVHKDKGNEKKVIESIR